MLTSTPFPRTRLITPFSLVARLSAVAIAALSLFAM